MIEARFRLEHGTLRLDVELVSAAPVIGIFGPSGSGKTSVLNAIGGLLRPVSGVIRVDGVLTDDPVNDVHLPPHRRRIGYVFQENRLFPHLTVEKNLLAGHRLLADADRRLKPEAIIRLLDLAPLLTRLPATLSGGEQRRVAIGRALLTSPRLLVLDEPLTGLDARLRDSVLLYLQRLTQQLAVQVIYVSHTLGDFLALAKTTAVIRESALRIIGPPELLLGRCADGEAESIEACLSGTVADSVSADAGMIHIEVGNSIVTVPGMKLLAGMPVRLVVPAHQVLLALPPLPKLSIRNRLPARVVSLHEAGDRVAVGLDSAGQRLFAVITPAAVRELGLRPGANVIACFKGHAARLTPEFGFIGR